MRKVTFAALRLFAALILVLPLIAYAADAKPEMVVVYWSSKDCKWCTWWEGLSGMERRFKASEEFKKIQYRVVKNERLADPYTQRDFPPDILWLYERIEAGDEKRTGRPGWVVYLDRKRIAAFNGQRDWDTKHFPEIKRLVAEHVGK